MSVIRNIHNRNYTCFGNEIVRFTHVPMKKRLSLRARGLLHMMLSYPPDWKFNGLDELIEEVPEGRDAVRAAFKELQELGYARKVRVVHPVTRQMLRWETVVSETPDLSGTQTITSSELEARQTQITEKPESGSQITGNPHSGKPRCLETQVPGNPHSGFSGAILNNDQLSIDQLSIDQLSNENGSAIAEPSDRDSIAQEVIEAEAEAVDPAPVESETENRESRPKEKGSDKGKSSAPRRSKAEKVYAQLQDLERFEKFWVWYREKICPIKVTRCGVAANPGNKAEAAARMVELEKSDFLGAGYEVFRLGCAKQWGVYQMTGGIDIPHACRFLLPSSGEPDWLVRAQEEKPEIAPVGAFVEEPKNVVDLKQRQKEAEKERQRAELNQGIGDALARFQSNPYLESTRPRTPVQTAGDGMYAR